MSNVLVQTPLSHSVDVSVGVTQVAPNVRAAGPEASGDASGAGAGELPEQAARTNDQERSHRCMTLYPTVAPRQARGGSCDRCVTLHDVRSPDLSAGRSARDRCDLSGEPLLRLAGLDRLHRDEHGEVAVDLDRALEECLSARGGVTVHEDLARQV